MITAGQNIQRLADTLSAVRNKDVVTAVDVVSAAGPEPIRALVDLFNSNQASSIPHTSINNSLLEFPEAPEWTAKQEEKFAKLARMKALGRLHLDQLADFEKMSDFRRAAAHLRSGEEIIAEYEQRTLTRDLVTALAKYVEFHQQHSPHRQRKAS